MRILAAFLASALAAAAQTPGIPCRNVKTDAQCAGEKMPRQRRDRSSEAIDRLTEVRAPGVVALDRILVEADPEDIPAPEPSRWEKFERSLKGSIVTEWVGNDGVKMWCRDPCPQRVNCCGRGPEFNTTGHAFGR